MEGFGRFRRSVHADANWELSKFRVELQTLGQAAVHHLGDFEIAKLKHVVMNNIRTPSFTSLASRSGSDSEESSSGPRVSRGFAPSKISLPTNTSKDLKSSMSNIRSRGTSPDLSERTSGYLRRHSKRSSFLKFDVDPAALATIDEAGDTVQKKKTVPLIFDTQGAGDEVIDDDEYESCEESFAPGQFTVRPDNHVTTTFVSNLHDKKAQISHTVLPNRSRGTRHYRTLDHVPEKARVGQKKSTKPIVRRLSSRGVKAPANRATSKENVPGAVEKDLRAISNAQALETNSTPSLATFAPKALPQSSDESAEDHPCIVGLYMADPKAATTASNENNDVSHGLNSMCQTITPGVPRSPRAGTQRRNRSNTAFRVHSGNIPIVYVEDGAKMLADIGVIKQENSQLVAT
jgi:hypothetical protein